MLPKPDKSKKSKNIEQLDLVETISAGDKLKHKRHWLYLTLFLTIGLSFLFWFYRSAKILIKTINFSHPQISVSIPAKDLLSILDSQTTQLLFKVSPGWSVSIFTGQQLFNWTKNTVNLNESEKSSIISILSAKKDKIKSNISSYLPEGINLQENLSDTVYQLLITVPERQILFIITFPKNSSNSFSTVSQLISSLYWTIVQY